MTITNDNQPSHDAHGGMTHAGHGWMMIACCIPMLIVAIALVATGVVGRWLHLRGGHVHRDDVADDAGHGSWHRQLTARDGVERRRPEGRMNDDG